VQLTPWQHMADARMAMLEAARMTHAEKISEQKGLLICMDEDMKTVQEGFRVQRGVLNSLRETQLEQGERLVRIETRVTAVESRLTGVETRLTGVETRLTEVEIRLTGVEGTLEKVHVGVDKILDLLTSATDSGS
jgi:hypothetical protein